jgi:hypothetical protein
MKKKLRKSQFGDKWAFTIDKATFKIEKGNAIYMYDGSTKYAFNGIARNKKDALELDSVWLDNPEIPGTKKSLQPIFNVLLE